MLPTLNTFIITYHLEYHWLSSTRNILLFKITNNHYSQALTLNSSIIHHHHLLPPPNVNLSYHLSLLLSFTAIYCEHSILQRSSSSTSHFIYKELLHSSFTIIIHQDHHSLWTASSHNTIHHHPPSFTITHHGSLYHFTLSLMIRGSLCWTDAMKVATVSFSTIFRY